jgi:hypothetical protein
LELTERKKIVFRESYIIKFTLTYRPTGMN